MVDASALGYHGPEFGFVIEAGKIRELARAVGSRQQAYLGSEPIAMPVLLKVAQFLWEPAEGSAVLRVGWDARTPPLHARQKFWFADGAPQAGTALSVRTAVADLRTRPSRSLGTVAEVQLDTEFRTASGTLVATACTTSVQPLPDRDAAHAARPLTQLSDEAHAASRLATASRSQAARRLGPITQTEIVRYQGASGDFNPVHHDPAGRHGSRLAGRPCAWAVPSRRALGSRYRAVRGGADPVTGPPVPVAIMARRPTALRTGIDHPARRRGAAR